LVQAAHRAGEVADLARVDDAERQPDAGDGSGDSRFEAAGCFQDNEGNGQLDETVGEFVQPLSVSRDTECLATRSEVHVEAILGNVDADEDGGRFVHDPTLMTLPCECGLRPKRLSGFGTAKVGAAPSSVPGLPAQV